MIPFRSVSGFDWALIVINAIYAALRYYSNLFCDVNSILKFIMVIMKFSRQFFFFISVTKRDIE